MQKYYWLNEKPRDFLSKDYLANGETVEERITAIAKEAERRLGWSGYAEKFEDYMAKGWISLSSPVWTNYGTDRGLPVSCNNSYIPDNMAGILEKNAEIGMMTKNGAGTSAYFGHLRERGAKISKGGESSGPVHFMQIFDSTTNVVSQASVRRGSMAAYLDLSHPDFEEFLMIRGEGNQIQNLSIGACISDEDMIEAIKGNADKRRRILGVIKKRMESGYPYVFFTDTVNNNAPKVYRDKKKRIYASNLCVAPETLLLTKEGHIPISSLEGQEVEVWNGKQWSRTTVVKTGKNQEMVRVDIICSEGQKSITVTPYHKFYSFNGTEVRARDLLRGVFLIDTILPDGSSVHAWVAGIAGAERSDTYCVNETLEHKAVFNGILTGNCSEICLPSTEDESFVCVLSSLNLEHYEDWKDTDLIDVMTAFLDTVTSEYVEKTEHIPFMKAAHNFAKNHRAIGLGVLGWHSYLQKHNIPFESMEAKLANTKIFKQIDKQSLEASKKLATQFGEPPLLQGYGERMTTRIAIAPTTSSSFILGQVSQGIEPLNSNYFVKKLAKGSYTYKNPYLKKVLGSYDKDDKDVWRSILDKGGSVQHLSFLSEREREVFKTFGEISQKEIIIQAAARQKYIDQSQSLNLMIPYTTDPRDIMKLMVFAWKSGVKTLYYQRSTNPAQEAARNILACKSCEA